MDFENYFWPIKLGFIYDVIVVGAGLAGLRTAEQLAAAGKEVAIIDKNGIGGIFVNEVLDVYMPSTQSLKVEPTGYTTGEAFIEHIVKVLPNNKPIDFAKEEVQLIRYNHGLIMLCCSPTTTYFCKSVVFATGNGYNAGLVQQYKSLKNPKTRNICVLGSDIYATYSSFVLSYYFKNVYTIDRAKTREQNDFLDIVEQAGNIQWLPMCDIKDRIYTRNKLSSMVLTTGDEIRCSAVLDTREQKPDNAFVGPFAKLDADGFIQTNIYGACALPGVFAAGACTGKNFKFSSEIMVEATVAAENVLKFLKETYGG